MINFSDRRPAAAKIAATALLGAAVLVAPIHTSPAAATMSVSQVIVEFSKPGQRRADVEVQNRGRERMYVLVSPAMIANPGTSSERRVKVADPGKLGLLVTPQRMILEPGQRKLVRFAMLAPPQGKDRIFRVTIKPVVGKLRTRQTAVKIVVGYDLLVMQRPTKAQATVTGQRKGRWLTVRNTGNTNALLFDGKQCRGTKNCKRLPARRIYAGASWKVKLPRSGPVNFLVRVGNRTTKKSF